MREAVFWGALAGMLLLFSACSGDSGDDGTPLPASTLRPTTTAAAIESTATKTPSPEDTPPPVTPAATATTLADVPQGNRTRIRAVDTVIEAIETQDAATFESLLRYTEAACDNAHPNDGEAPPQCGDIPGQPAEGTLVKAFYEAGCGDHWLTNVFPVVDAFFLSKPELFAVFKLNLNQPLRGDTYLPQPEYGLVFEMGGTATSGLIEYRVSLLLGVEADGAITVVDFPCDPVRTPDFFLSSEAEPVYGSNLELLLLGPAFQHRMGTQTGISGVDQAIEAVTSGDPAAIESLMRLTPIACTNDPGLGGPPKCADAPGSPAEGSEVHAFPAGQCEGAWTYDLSPIIDGLVAASPELYAVLWDRGAPQTSEFPQSEFRLVFASKMESISDSPLGLVVGVNAGKIRSVAYLCGEPPSYRVEHQDPGELVILYGPAFP